MRKPKLLVYIPYDFTSPNRGSSVRPYYLTRELAKIFDMTLISGDISQKRGQIKKFKKDFLANGSGIKAAYIESMNHPFRPFEIFFFWWLKSKGIKTGLFVRDIHWLFPGAFLNKNLRQRVKRWRHLLEYLTITRIMNLAFTPSAEFVPHLKKMGFRNIKLLPPGGQVINELAPSPQKKTLIYVGGVGGDRGEKLLVDSYQILRKQYPDLKLVIVGNEAPEVLDPYKDIAGIEVYQNKSALELDSLYRKASIGLIPLAPNPFYELARTIKVYEYMSYGLPVVTTPRKETAGVVRKEKIGEVGGDSPKEFATSIEKILSNPILYKKYSQNGLNSVKSRNSWSHRAQEIMEVLNQ